MNPSYSLFGYSTYNLGDDVQTVAASKLLEGKEFSLIDRDSENSQWPTTPTKLIANGWYIRKTLPFPTNIQPLLVSISYVNYSGLEREAFDFFRQHQPVGCRDLHTLKILSLHNIDCYLSYCLTLTLQRSDFFNQALADQKPIYLNDVAPSANIDQDLLGEAFPTAVRLTQELSGPLALGDQSNKKRILSQQQGFERLTLAKQRLTQLANANLVVTSRLHVALPCLAFGTPLIFLPPQNKPDNIRFSGYEFLLGFGGPKNNLKPITVNKNYLDYLTIPARTAIANFLR
jgi:hypothetical protein